MSDPDHPGHSAIGCPCRMVVTPAAYAPTGGGYSCRVTGGHCLPGDKCANYVKTWEDKILERSDEELRSIWEHV